MKRGVFVVLLMVLLSISFLTPTVLSQACKPETCQSLGKFCGVWHNGCGGIVDCERSCPIGNECNEETGSCEKSDPSISIFLETVKDVYPNNNIVHLTTESRIVSSNSTSRTGLLKLKLQKKQVTSHCEGTDVNRDGIISRDDLILFLDTLTGHCHNIDPILILRIINYLNNKAKLDCPEDSHYCGLRDVNHDGWVTPLDALFLVEKLNACTGRQFDFSGNPADFTNDGRVDSYDSSYFLALLENFPIGHECNENAFEWVDDTSMHNDLITVSTFDDFFLYPFWNGREIQLGPGEYRAYARFVSSIEDVEMTHEFGVLE